MKKQTNNNLKIKVIYTNNSICCFNLKYVLMGLYDPKNEPNFAHRDDRGG